MLTRITSRALVFGLLAVGGLLAVVAGSQPWWRARAEGGTVDFSGGEATGGLSQALAVVVLAGTLLALTLQAVGRRVLAVVLVLTGIGVVAVAVAGSRPVGDVVASRVRQVTLADKYAVAATAWPWVCLVGGVITAVAAIAMLAAAGRWPRRPARFDRTRRLAARLAAGDQDLAADPASAWQAQDQGLDPTLDHTPGSQSSATGDAPGVDPDVHRADSRVTMEPDTHPER